MRAIIASFFFLSSIWGVVVEVETLADIAPISEDSIVFFDVDDTLIRYPSHLGSECWFCDVHDQEIADFLTDHLQVVPVEEKTLDFVWDLQRRGVRVWGITGRDDRRLDRQVRSIGLNLTQVFHCNGRKKGEVAVEQWVESPQTVILIDDRLSDVKEFDQKMESLGIPCIAYWYRAIEPSRHAYDAEAAWRELAQLHLSCK